MNDLDLKINAHFGGLVVRKDLVKEVKGNAIVPTFVLEYLLGQYCASDDEETIRSGINTVKEILARHYVHRNEANLTRATIKEKGHHKVIDKIAVTLNDKKDVYEAQFANLGLKEVLVDSDTIKAHPKLLVNGVWCIAELEYEPSEDKKISPWIMESLKPIQLSSFDMDLYLEQRQQFSTDEWIDLLVQSIGFSPEHFSKRGKLFQLLRLVPFCERNYNLIELGPKGTGKSHIYSEFSPHGMLLSGGEVTVPKLFVNNSNGRIGLVGYWDTVAFDEFAGKDKKVDKALVDILKGYMANKTFSRGIETLGAEASLAFVGNTQRTVPSMLKNTDLFDGLPDKYRDSAFLDRLYYYIPGWEVDIIRGEMFSSGYGFVVDYLAEVLRSFRDHDFSDRIAKHFTLASDLSTRDRDGIRKTFSGLMKILHPTGEATKEEMEEILRFALEGRKRVKDQMIRIDKTFTPVHFGYKDNSSDKDVLVTSLEEREYPRLYHRDGEVPQELKEQTDTPKVSSEEGIGSSVGKTVTTIPKLKEHQLMFDEDQKGISYDMLFGPYLGGVTEITITDPYIRSFYQIRNIMEFLETVVKFKAPEDEVKVHLITRADDFERQKQQENLDRIIEMIRSAGVEFTWEFDQSQTIHARHIITDTGWKIDLDRGLDIFQKYEMNDALSLANRLQEFRQCKKFQVTYIMQGNED
jgi:ATP-dependent Lon protease